MLDFRSYVPASLPLEFSKLSAKLLDIRARERKAVRRRGGATYGGAEEGDG
jgi:hypothetical protein